MPGDHLKRGYAGLLRESTKVGSRLTQKKRQPRLPPLKIPVAPRLGDAATRTTPRDSNHLNPSFRFAQVDEGRYCLHHCEKDDIRRLVKVFGRMEKMTWLDVWKSDGLHYEHHDSTTLRAPIQAALVDLLPPDVGLDSFRVTLEFRIYGYRVHDSFYVVWFDRAHDVCPD